MNEAAILAVLREELSRIAPEIDFGAIDPAKPIQQEFDIDSMDFLTYVTAIHTRLGVNVPESEYANVATISGALAYLAAKISGRA